MNKRSAALVLASLCPLMSGCVAAAIPLAAGAVMAREQLQGGKVAAKPPSLPQAASGSDLKVTLSGLTALPPPDAIPTGSDQVVDAFREYAVAQLALQPGAKRPSALLTRAADLRSDRVACTPRTNGVFVDLDPGRGTFDPLAPGRPNVALAATLAELRDRGVAVVWFSRLGASFEGPTRAALAAAGLDPTGGDRLVLLSDLNERKQSRRDELAKQFCPLAMVGDERADFDELYLYLKQPDAAMALDAMIGRGWFLASPFTRPSDR